MGLFGRKTVSTPTSAPPPPAQKQGCCHHVSRALLSGIITTILFCIFGLAICALVGRRYYWFYYTANSSDPGAYWISGGWLDFADRDLGNHSLKDANFGLWIIGIISAAALAASAIIAFMEFFVSITGNAGRHTAGLAFPLGIITVGILICYIAAAAIEMDKWSSNNDGTKYRVWPSWGWICAIVAGALWFFVGTFAACMGPKYGKAKYGGTTAQGYPSEHHYPTTPVAGAAGAGAGAGAAAGQPKRGWFGRNKNNAGAAPGTPQQSYAAQPFNANQGPAGANRDVEMGNTGVPHNGHHGHGGEALAAGGGVGLGAAAAAHHHDQRQAQNAAPAKEKRGLFGRKKVTTPTAAGGTANDQPTYANQPTRAHPEGGAFPQGGTNQGGVNQPGAGPAGNGYPRQGGDQGDGAWAGGRMSDQEGQRGGAWPAQGQTPAGSAAGAGTGAGTGAGMGTGGAAPAGQTGRAGSANMGRAESTGKKKGMFSFYH